MVIKISKYAWSLLLLFSLSFAPAQKISKTRVLWYNLINKSVSDNGKWVYYVKSFENSEQQGILRNTKSGKEWSMASPSDFVLDNNYFVVLTKDEKLMLVDLKTNKLNFFDGITNFQYDARQKKLLMQSVHDLTLLDLHSNTKKKWDGITRFEDIPNSPCNLMYRNNEKMLLNRTTGSTAPLFTKATKILTFLGNSKQRQIKIFLQNGTDYRLTTLDETGTIISSRSKPITDTTLNRHYFVTENILLSEKPLKNKLNGNEKFEVWSSHDEVVKPKLINRINNAQRMELWDTSQHTEVPKRYDNYKIDYYAVFDGNDLLEIHTLANNDFGTTGISPEPRIVLRNRETGTIIMQVDKVKEVHASSKGTYLLYFAGRNWYYFDLKTRQTTNITASSNVPFYEYDRLNDVPFNVDSPVFSPDYKTIYLTSKNDIWQYSFEQKKLTKLTDFADKNIAFKIIEGYVDGSVRPMIWNDNRVVTSDFLLLKMEDHSTELTEGLAFLRSGHLTVLEKPSPKSISQIKKSNSAVSYLIEDANTAPQLFSISFGKNFDFVKKCNTLTPLPVNFPKTELHHWINSEGQATYTTVILPQDYSPLKKYPAIVRVYENEAKGYKDFVYPSYYNSSGFNRTLLAEEGYIVIMPKIIYVRNRVGDSALKSVEETLRKAEKWYNIDSANIGIIGHSFGGYETDYIVTHSKLFKTAISGSGIADIISDYFTVHKMYDNSNMSRYTNEQFGFSAGFFALKKDYLVNNPILFADKVETPLLLWSGRDDVHVEWRQSVELFMALSSLKKETRLLLFPHDAHVLVRPDNQKEATTCFLQWFDYYLKNKPKPDWF